MGNGLGKMHTQKKISGPFTKKNLFHMNVRKLRVAFFAPILTHLDRKGYHLYKVYRLNLFLPFVLHVFNMNSIAATKITQNIRSILRR